VSPLRTRRLETSSLAAAREAAERRAGETGEDPLAPELRAELPAEADRGRALEIGDIEWERGTVYVQRAWSEKAKAVGPLKDSDKRRVPLTKELRRALQKHIALINAEGYKGTTIPCVDDRGRKSERHAELMFPNRAHRLEASSGAFYDHFWTPLQRELKQEPKKYHATRHTFATWALESGEEPLRVMAYLGHASLQQRSAPTTTRASATVASWVGWRGCWSCRRSSRSTATSGDTKGRENHTPGPSSSCYSSHFTFCRSPLRSLASRELRSARCSAVRCGLRAGAVLQRCGWPRSRHPLGPAR